jgi:predicted metallopeptidase
MSMYYGQCPFVMDNLHEIFSKKFFWKKVKVMSLTFLKIPRKFNQYLTLLVHFWAVGTLFLIRIK